MLRKSGLFAAFIIFALVTMMMSWELNRTDAAVVQGAIPQESIRLRILANSDSAADQAVKRQIRDKIVAQMNTWVEQLEEPQSLEEARRIVTTHLSEIEAIVAEELEAKQIDYGYQVDFGNVPFPTKMYGDQVYPAGDYEAVRVTLGKGEGQNWWCVLFPPLCFIDAGTGEAVAKSRDGQEQAAQGNADAKTDAKSVKANGKAEQGAERINVGAAAAAGETEVRFFLWDWLMRLFDFIAGLFA
ncbi:MULTISPECIES: stage II sporulation protein R [unclassified Paenibacillus]|uniref:stage II sporulation protein R n=1 Tax=unclassified Paenibacillus TaxID=185978 RepID=UPI001C1054CA|nr:MULTISPECIES: stage II sporulation protein R [unclassified Paenibacillus]MBU5441710.1 stage II sporulation protein R [Paenibacillus sp. MSJ-34]CAH0118098.1 hypothetical protein PAE9249_00564 [Paenibacillus sp. CECT 9249]